jgi:hypothetical protein
MDRAFISFARITFGGIVSKTEDLVEKALASKINGYLLKFFRMTTTVCITATIAVTGGLYTFGTYLYNNSEATKAAIDTFIEVKKNHDNL